MILERYGGELYKVFFSFINSDSDIKKNSEDALLLSKIKNRDMQSFEILVNKYQNFVYRTIFFELKNEQDTYDVCQEVFLKVYKSIEKFRFDSEFSTWLFRICKNCTYDFVRKNYKNKTVSLTVSDDGEPCEIDICDSAIANNPEDSVLRKEKQELVRDAIDELPKDHKEIILLRDINELSYSEIADILGIAEGTVKSRISRARISLKKLLEDKKIL